MQMTHTIDEKENTKYWLKFGTLTKDNTIPFYGDKDEITGCCSNFYACNFNMTLNGKNYTFNCSEQAFMLQKCLLFDKDNDTLIQNIMNEKDPMKIKNYGRQVKNFNEAIWEQHRYQAMYDAVMAKFSQNPGILKWLISTKDKILIEASPYDAIWGVKMRGNDPDIYDPTKWNGLNLLGMVLMDARDALVPPHTT